MLNYSSLVATEEQQPVLAFSAQARRDSPKSPNQSTALQSWLSTSFSTLQPVISASPAQLALEAAANIAAHICN